MLGAKAKKRPDHTTAFALHTIPAITHTCRFSYDSRDILSKLREIGQDGTRLHVARMREKYKGNHSLTAFNIIDTATSLPALGAQKLADSNILIVPQLFPSII